VELGLKFQASANGYITGIRFYKGTGNTGTHRATCGAHWQPLAGCLYNETATGQQQAPDRAMAITANTTYVVSYYARAGNYAVNAHTIHPRLPILHCRRWWNIGGNGVMQYGTGGFPPRRLTRVITGWTWCLTRSFPPTRRPRQ
jgi:hypothetical protein